MTFTEAATKELRDRIRTRLTQAAEVFSEAADESDPPAETALIYQLRNESYPDPASWPECRKAAAGRRVDGRGGGIYYPQFL